MTTSKAAELTRETSHMPVVPHGCTPEALQHPPPLGAHSRGRLLDGARATFTDHATPEDVYHRHRTRTVRRYCSS